MNVAAESQQAVEVPADVPVYSIRDSWRFAALLFAIDAICLGQFGFAALPFGRIDCRIEPPGDDGVAAEPAGQGCHA